MAEYHVGCGVFGIYAGTLNKKNPSMWQNKSEVTEEAIAAVADYMAHNCLGSFTSPKQGKHGYSWELKDGRTLKLLVEIVDDKAVEE
jgi:hypothetical protein